MLLIKDNIYALIQRFREWCEPR